MRLVELYDAMRCAPASRRFKPDPVPIAAHIGVGHRATPGPGQLSRRPVGEFAFSQRYGAPLV